MLLASEMSGLTSYHAEQCETLPFGRSSPNQAAFPRLAELTQSWGYHVSLIDKHALGGVDDGLGPRSVWVSYGGALLQVLTCQPCSIPPLQWWSSKIVRVLGEGGLDSFACKVNQQTLTSMQVLTASWSGVVRCNIL